MHYDLESINVLKTVRETIGKLKLLQKIATKFAGIF